jgi:hypothetical protein
MGFWEGHDFERLRRNADLNFRSRPTLDYFRLTDSFSGRLCDEPPTITV